MAGQAKKTQRKALGRGLRALISSPEDEDKQRPEDNPLLKANPATVVKMPSADTVEQVEKGTEAEPAQEHASIRELDVDCLNANSDQPRKDFDSEELKELANSIAELGVIQPILVRPLTDYQYEIIAGERRWRAAKLAGLRQVPVFIRDLEDRETFEVAIVENVQRSDLSPTEEARAYQRLIDQFHLTQREVAERVGKDRATVANSLRLLGLAPEVLQMLDEGKLSLGHAKVILGTKEPSVQKNLAKKCIDEGLSVRALESIVSRVVVLDKKKRKSKKTSASGDLPEVADRLRKSFGTKVLIKHNEKSGRGKLSIEYFSEEELERIIDICCGA